MRQNEVEDLEDRWRNITEELRVVSLSLAVLFYP